MIVGTGAGADASLSLRTLMGKRARLIGTMLRGRPSIERRACRDERRDVGDVHPGTDAVRLAHH